MHDDDARALIEAAIPAGDTAARWAELGAGTGTFTRALATLLGPRGHVYAVDRDRTAVAALARLAREDGMGARAAVTPVPGDLTDADLLRVLGNRPLDGVVLANALHFVAAEQQPAVLARLAGWLRPGGRIVLVEYEERGPSRWVPAPVPFARLARIAPPECTAPVRVGVRRSAYGGQLYAAFVERVRGQPG
jgi:SAM-dependent methyltransferase